MIFGRGSFGSQRMKPLHTINSWKTRSPTRPHFARRVDFHKFTHAIIPIMSHLIFVHDPLCISEIGRS